jgi:hypothetical protein
MQTKYVNKVCKQSMQTKYANKVCKQSIQTKYVKKVFFNETIIIRIFFFNAKLIYIIL